MREESVSHVTFRWRSLGICGVSCLEHDAAEKLVIGWDATFTMCQPIGK